MKNKSILIAIFFIIFSQSLIAQTAKNRSLYVVSFNVLAPCWTSPDYYPAEAKPYLDRILRRNKIITFLNSVAVNADIITLQETTQIEFGYFKQALQDRFYAFQAYHDPQYWSNWITQDPKWEPNGVAIFVKKTSFTNVNFSDLPLTNDGNHSAYFEGIQQTTGIKVRAASVHLDNESSRNRGRELNFLMHHMSRESTVVDIVAGDFNYGTQSGVLKYYLDKNHFVDALHYVDHEEWTSPFSENGKKNAGIIDHIAVRNSMPIDGHVYNFGLWQLYPNDETKRIVSNFQNSGSDHFPIFSIVQI